MPVDVDIIYSWVQAGVDVVSLVWREDDVSSVATVVKGFENCWNVVGGVVSAWMDCTSGAPIVIRDGHVLCCHSRDDGHAQQSCDRVSEHFGMWSRSQYGHVQSFRCYYRIPWNRSSMYRLQMGTMGAHSPDLRPAAEKKDQDALHARFGGSWTEALARTY